MATTDRGAAWAWNAYLPPEPGARSDALDCTKCGVRLAARIVGPARTMVTTTLCADCADLPARRRMRE